jgi:C-methyltransferase C-terminal domain/Putative zinc binding domain/Methyltransferase domain
VSHQKRDTCRACDSNRLQLILPMGEMPLANAFLKTTEDFAAENFYPLNVYFCEACSLVQLLDVVDPEILFRNYIYVSGTSETMAAHYEEYANTVIELGSLGPRDLVIEIASNDGSLLNHFRRNECRTLGIEPAENISQIAREKGLDIVSEFFSFSFAQTIRESPGPAKVVIANNVLAHVDDTRDFLLGCGELLVENGFVVIEVPYLRELLGKLEYDTIYHEHLCYFSITSLLKLFETAKLGVFRISFVPIHGGSLRIFAARHLRHSNTVVEYANEESADGMRDIDRYHEFARAVERNRAQLRQMLHRLKSEGKRIAAYGAPAKGNTLLNYCDVGTDLISYTVDKSALKVGLFTPGKHIPVRHVSTLLEDQPDFVLLLAWNFAKEIMKQQQEYRNHGGRFISPLPQPEIV